jgi:hypothetical protein
MITCPKCRFHFVSTIRSNPQNRFYWSVCVGLISEHTGFSPEEVHEILKHKFLNKEVIIKEKDKKYFFHITKSTTELLTGEFKRYIEEIQQWSAESLGLVIPDPIQ